MSYNDGEDLLRRVIALERKIAELDARTVGSAVLGPRRDKPLPGLQKEIDALIAGSRENPVAPVNRANRMLSDGTPVPADQSHTEDRGDGRQKGYVVLTAEERAKGFVRPVRNTYVHNVCNTETRMGDALAETYARDPGFYNGTFCVHCGTHKPLNEFVWADDGTQVGS